MNEQQHNRCHIIIHSHAAAAAAGNLIPLPGSGIAVDVMAMTSMCMSLCAVLGGDISSEVAKNIAIISLKDTLLKKPINVLCKELSKIIPILGQLVAPTLSVAFLEAAGWNMVANLEIHLKNQELSH